MTKLTGIGQIEWVAKREHNLDTICYRGDAPLAHIALVSRADVYDSVTNPQGLQRDLSPAHAQKAYDYARRAQDAAHPRAFPEVVLNVRDRSAVDIEEFGVPDAPGDLVRVRFDLAKVNRDGKVAVSRVDGNHRLYFAAGDERREPLLLHAPVQMHVGLTREQEASLFVDINANQKGLNSSHLSVLRANLTSEEIEIKEHMPRWIARKLAETDPDSPWHGLIHMGGSKTGARAQGLTRVVNFASLEAGVGRTLAKSQYIHDFTSPDAQYLVIRLYWEAVKRVFAEEWARPKENLLLKNIGVLSLSILAGTIIDRCIARRKIEVGDIVFYLDQAKSRFDWSKEATGGNAISGMSGNRAALIVAGEMASELRDEEDETRAMQALTDRLVRRGP